jgi:class 3 adenylate cyclase
LAQAKSPRCTRDLLLYAEVEDDVEVEPVGEVTLAGIQRPVPAFNVVAVRETTAKLFQS